MEKGCHVVDACAINDVTALDVFFCVRDAYELQVELAFGEDDGAAADLNLARGGGCAVFTAVCAAVGVQMGEDQGRALHFFALDDLAIVAVFD